MIAAAALVLLLSAADAPSVPDEDRPRTRAESLRRERLKKAARPRPPDEPGFIERTLLALERAERPGLLDFNVGGVYPRLQGIASGSQTAAGARLWQPDIGGTAWDVHGSGFYSLKGYELYDLQVGRIPHRGPRFPLRSTKGDDVYELGDLRRGTSRLVLYGSFRYRHNPEEDFFGLGDRSRREDHASFRLQDASYELVTGYPLGSRAILNVRGGLRQVSLGPGEDDDLPTLEELFFDDVAAPGLLRQPDFLYVTTSVLMDRRDEPGNPHRGFMAAVSHTLYDDRGGEDFRFQRLAADVRGFMPLGSLQRVLALRALISRDKAAEGQRVPFYLQETLGGSHTLRGFENFRFRGERLLALQAEYRWEAAPALELVLFADAGKAVGREGFGLRGLHADYGFGVRLKTFESVLVRLDVARSNEQSRVLLRFSPSY